MGVSGRSISRRTDPDSPYAYLARDRCGAIRTAGVLLYSMQRRRRYSNVLHDKIAS
jgi:hypothetical protein